MEVMQTKDPYGDPLTRLGSIEGWSAEKEEGTRDTRFRHLDWFFYSWLHLLSEAQSHSFP